MFYRWNLFQQLLTARQADSHSCRLPSLIITNTQRAMLSCILHAGGILRLVLHVRPATFQQLQLKESVGEQRGPSSLILIRQTSSVSSSAASSTCFFSVTLKVRSKQTTEGSISRWMDGPSLCHAPAEAIPLFVSSMKV